MAKKYDIIVHDQDPQVPPKPQNGVIAENPQALMRIFGMCGEKVEIVREYEDEDSKNYGKQKIQDVPQGFEFANGGGVGAATGFMKVDPNLPKYNPTPTVTNPTQINTNVQTTNVPSTTTYTKTSEPPRYFEVGGIKCKMENGKMYQKQWMRLSDNESQEFRIVSDTNNKICPIKGKHIEIMKWVLIEDENDSIETTEEKKLELLNG